MKGEQYPEQIALAAESSSYWDGKLQTPPQTMHCDQTKSAKD